MNEALCREAAMSMIDLRHADWNKPGTPCVNIVESPSPADLLAECQEGVALHAALRQAHIPCRYYLATNKETFGRALQLIAAQRRFAQHQPITLHISCHGNNERIGLTSSEHFTWDQLRLALIDFGLQSCAYLEKEKVSTLILCMSTCFGLFAHQMSEMGQRPFMTLVAPCRAVSWSDSLVAFLTFYNLFLEKNKPCGEAVRAMNTAAGESDLFLVADFSEEVKAWVASQSAQSSNK